MAPSTIGTLDAILNSEVNGFTLQDLPVASKIKVFLPNTTILACESSSVLGRAVESSIPVAAAIDTALTDATTAWMVWSLGKATNVETIAESPLPSRGRDDSFHFLFLRIPANLTLVAGMTLVKAETLAAAGAATVAAAGAGGGADAARAATKAWLVDSCS